jgi:hypothetical protein
MRVLPVAIVAFLAGLVACGGSPTSPSAGSNFTVMLKDSPFSDAKAVLVTFSEVDVHRDGDADFTKVGFSGSAASRTCDLKKLESAQDVLGVGTLAAGHYTQVRLVVAAASLYFENASDGNACASTIAAPGGRSASLDISSGDLKLNREFDVPSSGATTMTLDFDGDQSIHETGNGRYMMRPVVTVAGVQ